MFNINVFNEMEEFLNDVKELNSTNYILLVVSDMIDSHCSNEELLNYLLQNDSDYINALELKEYDYIYLFDKYELNKNESFIRTIKNELNYRYNLSIKDSRDYEIMEACEYILKQIEKTLLTRDNKSLVKIWIKEGWYYEKNKWINGDF